jgi:hypothetical protein
MFNVDVEEEGRAFCFILAQIYVFLLPHPPLLCASIEGFCVGIVVETVG